MSPQLQKKLASYSLFTGSILTAGCVKAQVIYTDLMPDITLERTVESLPFDTVYALDLNGDSIADFSLFTRSYTNSGNSQVFYSQGIQPQGFNSIAVLSQQSFLPLPINDCDTIDAENPGGIWTSSVGILNLMTSSSIYGVGNAADFYAGLRLDINGNFYYGWIRFDINPDASRSIVIKDYAYEATPNTGIRVGCGVGIDELNKSGFSMTPNPSTGSLSITITNGFHPTMLNITDMMGRDILSKAIEPSLGNSFHLDLSHLSPGIYLIELDNGKAQVTGKWVKD